MHSATPTGECRSWNAHASLLCILFLVMILLVGCGEEPVYLAVDGTETSAEAGTGIEASSDTDAETGESGDFELSQAEGSIESGSSDSAQGTEDSGLPVSECTVCVYVCGAVEAPGLYMLDEGSRVYDAIEAAGGLKEDACEDYWNQAQYVTDGQMIDVPTQDEVEAGIVSSAADSGTSAGSPDGTQAYGVSGSDSGSSGLSGSAVSGKININTAAAEELTQIPGIGEARAEAIISYREQSGGFSAIEDIKNVSGIGDALFEKMKDYIEV